MIQSLLARRTATVAGILACVAVLFTVIYFRMREQSLADLGRPIRCLVAAHDLPAQTPLAKEMMAWREIPRQFAAPGVLTDMTQAVGRITLTPLQAGEPITQTRVAAGSDGAGFAGAIPDHARAISLPVDAVSGVAGLIAPGNVVDIITTFDFGNTENAQSFTMTLLENVRVLAVGRRMTLTGDATKNGVNVSEQTITVALSPVQVQRVIFAQEMGRMRFALRPQGEQPDSGATAPTEAATAASVTGMPNLMRRKEYRGR